MSLAIAKTRLTKIACYPIVGKLSVGGHGTVYIGQDPQDGGEIAIKVLSEQMSNDPILRMRFAQECQIARRVQHPNIVRVLDFGLDGNKPFLVMEYVKGESLGDRIEREERLPEKDAVAVATQIGEALHWVHQRGLIHRDIKPDNILLAEDGTAKLADLGMVKNLHGDFNLTRTQSAMGTPNFTAPEQFDDAKRVDALTDLYGLAATMYMAVTGQLPFQGRAGGLATTYKHKLSNTIAAPRELVPEISARVSAAICQGLRANPKERQANMLEFVQALAEPPAAKAPAPAPRKKATPAKSDANADRRRNLRRAVTMNARCRSVDAGRSDRWSTAVVNISLTGICLELKRRFEPGTVLTLMLGKKALSRRSILARVMWVKQKSNRSWELGCQYDQPLTDDEVRDLS